MIDTALEATIVGSFTKLGYLARSQLDGWEPPPADALDGQTVVITGGSSGIGRAAAAQSMELGAAVVVTSRDLGRAETAARELTAAASRGSARGLAVDTGDLPSVRALADALRQHTPGVDVLVHNAGALTADYRTNAAGMEQTLASHLVGPYLLTELLRGHLTDGARVLWMASGGMYTQRLDVDHLEMDPDHYRGSVAYARAKRAQVELVAELGPSWAPQVVMHALHPGWVDTPGVESGIPGFGRLMGPTLRSPAQGAETLVWLAATGQVEHAGCFWLDRRPRRTVYVPGTGATPEERRRLLTWLDRATAG